MNYLKDLYVIPVIDFVELTQDYNRNDKSGHIVSSKSL